MTSESEVYEKTYNDYLAQVLKIDFQKIAPKLGVQTKAEEAIIPVFGKPYTISPQGIADPSGKKPYQSTCIILFKYLLLCPHNEPEEKDWVTFRDLKDSGPLTVYWANNAEHPIAKYFSGNLNLLTKACETLGGYSPDLELPYDLTRQFDLLPKVPMLLLFNDADDEFPATCSVLYERCSESYLDAECLAMAGNLLYDRLKKGAGS